MRIIDSHMHVGPCRIFDLNIAEDDLIDSMNRNGIDASIVQPFPGNPDPKEGHNLIAGLSKEHKGRIYGLVSINPHQDEAIVTGEIERCVKELGFVGVKAHTIGHALNPLTKDADVLWKAANEFGISVMVHTGPGMHFALPSMVIPKAEDFPDVPIVLAHAGFGFFAAEALLLAQRYDNIYLEISWSPSYDVTAMVESVPDKVLFGTDLLENTPIELAKIKALNLAEDIRKKIFEENAIRVFKLRV